jgi:methyltransferase family protein
MTSPLDPRLTALINPDLLFAEPERFSDMGFWHEHIPFAFVLMDLLAPRNLVELGAHKGDSYFAFCQAVVRLGLPTRCHAVDSWHGDVHTSAYDDKVYEDFSAWNERHYASFSTPMRMTFDEASAKFTDGSVDLLHIDGTHTYEAVKHDFETWLPKMSERGVLLFHDSNVHREQYGVWKLWQEISAGRAHFEFLHGNGLGVLITGSAVPQKFLEFAELAHAMPDAVAALFQAFGQRVARGARSEAQALRIAALETTQGGLFRDLDTARKEQDSLGKAHAVLIEQRRLQEERLAAIERELAAVRHKLTATNAGIATSEAELARVYASNSWRITAPLRRLGKLLRRE